MSTRLRAATIVGAGALIVTLGTGISLAQVDESSSPTDTTVVDSQTTSTTTAPPEQTPTEEAPTPQDPPEPETTTTTGGEQGEETEAPDDEAGTKSGPGNQWFRDCLAQHGVAWPPGVGYHKPERKGPPSEELRQQIRAAKDACTGGDPDDDANGDDPDTDNDDAGQARAGGHPGADRQGPPAFCENGPGRGHCKAGR
ncbi:MAG: hypothetical protein WHS89_09680 [Acidimicrobiales bacterium]